MRHTATDTKNPFGLYVDEKTSFFIDGHSFYGLTRALSANVDYSKMLTYFRDESRMIRAHYFTTLVEDQEYSSIRPLLDWLSYHGYRVFTKPVREFINSTGQRKFQGSVEVEIAVSILEAAEYSDHIVLFSGNGNFVSAIEAVQRKGVRVTVASSASMIADDLRRQADHEVDLSKPGILERFMREDEPHRTPAVAGATRTITPRPTTTIRSQS